MTALNISSSGTPPQFPEIVDLHQSFNVFKRILEEVWGSSDLGEIVPHERVDGCDKITAAVADRIGIHDDLTSHRLRASDSWKAEGARPETSPAPEFPQRYP